MKKEPGERMTTGEAQQVLISWLKHIWAGAMNLRNCVNERGCNLVANMEKYGRGAAGQDGVETAK